jgi:hypothetical protein
MTARRTLLCVTVAMVGSAGTARASKWTGPTLLVVEAREWGRIPCPRQGVLSAGEQRPWWVLPAAGLCLKARWKLLEAHNQWPKAMTDAFVAHLGKYVYLSAAEMPSGPASLLLVPGPRYEERGKAIVGTMIRARLLGASQRFTQIEVNLLRPQTDSVQGDRLRLELRWTGWRRGKIAAGPDSTTDLTLIVRRACLPGPVDLGKCATHAGIRRSGKDAILSTIKVKGIVDFAAPPSDALDDDGNPERVRFALGPSAPARHPTHRSLRSASPPPSSPLASLGLAKASRALAPPGEGEGEARGGRVAGWEVPRAWLRQRGLAPFAGTLLLDVPLDGDGGGTTARRLLSLRVAGDELEEAWPPAARTDGAPARRK